jgi:hypothetical protein
MSDAGHPGWQGPFDESNLPAALTFMMRQMMAGNSHVALVLVKAVTASQTAGAPPKVDVQPMVAQVDQTGTATPHGIIRGIPCARLQAGATAIVIDPQVGDIGVMVCADRDITSALANQAPANPGSFRRFDWADGMYLFGVASVVPTSCAIAVNASGVTISGDNGNLYVEGNLGSGNGVTASIPTFTGQTQTFTNGILTNFS